MRHIRVAVISALLFVSLFASVDAATNEQVEYENPFRLQSQLKDRRINIELLRVGRIKNFEAIPSIGEQQDVLWMFLHIHAPDVDRLFDYYSIMGAKIEYNGETYRDLHGVNYDAGILVDNNTGILRPDPAQALLELFIPNPPDLVTTDIVIAIRDRQTGEKLEMTFKNVPIR